MIVVGRVSQRQHWQVQVDERLFDGRQKDRKVDLNGAPHNVRIDAVVLVFATFEKQGVIVRSSNYTLYGDMSRRVVEVLRRFSPEVEVYSIDEAFLNLRGFEGRLEARARELRAMVLKWTGIPVSVGIAPTKTLAKAANRTAKKRIGAGGVVLLMDEASQLEALAGWRSACRRSGSPRRWNCATRLRSWCDVNCRWWWSAPRGNWRGSRAFRWSFDLPRRNRSCAPDPSGAA
jgi:hypothetical protein